jgi:hypothetical protein
MANSHIEGRKTGSHSMVLECARIARSSKGSPVIVGARIPVLECVLATVSAIPKMVRLHNSVTAATE